MRSDEVRNAVEGRLKENGKDVVIHEVTREIMDDIEGTIVSLERQGCYCTFFIHDDFNLIEIWPEYIHPSCLALEMAAS